MHALEIYMTNFALTLFRTKNRALGAIFPSFAAKQARGLFLRPRRYPVKDWEAQMETRGRRMSYSQGLSALAWGESERKVLLVHGWESRATQMSGFVDELVNAGYQVIAIDGPAHGHSQGRRANPYLFAQAVTSAYQTLGPFEGVVGHSMGGNAVATAIAEGIDPSRVVLISSPSSIEGVLQRFASFVGLPKRSKHRFIGLIEQAVGKPAWALNTACNIRNTQAKGLVIHDRADLEIPFSDAEKIIEEWQSAALYVTDGYGHRAIVRQPQVWKKVVDFMA